MLPEATRSVPAISPNNVVLPDPLGPTRAVLAPDGTLNSCTPMPNDEARFESAALVAECQFADVNHRDSESLLFKDLEASQFPDAVNFADLKIGTVTIYPLVDVTPVTYRARRLSSHL